MKQKLFIYLLTILLSWSGNVWGQQCQNPCGPNVCCDQNSKGSACLGDGFCGCHSYNGGHDCKNASYGPHCVPPFNPNGLRVCGCYVDSDCKSNQCRHYMQGVGYCAASEGKTPASAKSPEMRRPVPGKEEFETPR